jgi:hypothetical protein
MYLETAFPKIRTILQANTIVARIMDAIFFSQAKKMFILISVNLSKISLHHNTICKKYCFKPAVAFVRHYMTAVCVCVWRGQLGAGYE